MTTGTTGDDTVRKSRGKAEKKQGKSGGKPEEKRAKGKPERRQLFPAMTCTRAR